MLSNKFVKAKDRLTRLYDHEPSPLFRRAFRLESLPESAIVTIGTSGFYKLYLNGEEITKGALAPYISNPNHYVYYDEYDVSSRLREGINVIVVMLGNGFANPTGGINWGFDKADFISPLSFALSLELTRDGSRECLFEADEHFRATDSPYDYDDIRMGVVYDARRELDRLFEPDFNDDGFTEAIPTTAPLGEKRLCSADPILPRYEITPKSIEFVGDGYYMIDECRVGAESVEGSEYKSAFLYDFGENNAGTVRLKINAPEGKKIVLRLGELLIDGKFQLRNLSSVKNEEIFKAYVNYNQRIAYTCKAGENIFTPDFTYFGFRYVLVEGITKEEATPELLTYVVLSSSVERKTTFSSSSKILNKLFEATVTSDYSNLFYIPTDCPHREKNGWTGDASVSAEQFMLNLGAEKTLKEWMRNVAKAQDENGVIPGVVPTTGWCYTGLRGPLWDAVCVNIPYHIYKYSADIGALVESSDLIFNYLSNIKLMKTEQGLIDYGLTDWNQPDRKSSAADSPRVVTDTAQSIEIARLARDIFKIIGDKEREAEAEALRVSLRADFRRHLIDKESFIVLGECQTSQAIAIAFGIFEDSELSRARGELLRIIERDERLISSGLLGLRYIFHVLCDMGRSDLALEMILADGPISYGYWMECGSNTLWETFARPEGNHVSKNHHYFGDISSIFVQRIAGLQPNPYTRDVNEFRISPELSCGLEYAEASYKTKNGCVSVHWRRMGDGEFSLSVDIPTGVFGQIKLRDGYSFTDGETEKPLIEGKYSIIKL